MTIKECIKKYGWQTEVSGPLKRFQSVDIDFVNSDGLEDETQFDISGAGTAEGIKKLTDLFSGFCKENGFKTNSVTSVTIVHVADTRHELAELSD